MTTITLVWPLDITLEWESYPLEDAFEMIEIARDAWPERWMPRGMVGNRNEIMLDIPHLGALLERMPAIKRVFAAFGIAPEIEVDGKPLLAWAWQRQVESVHRFGLVNQAMKALRKRPAMDDGNAAIRVALRDGLNKPLAEIELDLLTNP